MKKGFYLIPTSILAFALTTTSCVKKHEEKVVQEQLKKPEETLVSKMGNLADKLARRMRRSDISWHFFEDSGIDAYQITLGLESIRDKGENKLDKFLKQKFNFENYKSIEHYSAELNKSFPYMVTAFTYGDIEFVDESWPGLNVRSREYKVSAPYKETITLYERVSWINARVLVDKPTQREITAKFKDNDKTYRLYLRHSPSFYVSESISPDKGMGVSRVSDCYDDQYERPENGLLLEEHVYNSMSLVNFAPHPNPRPWIKINYEPLPTTGPDVNILESFYKDMLKKLD